MNLNIKKVNSFLTQMLNKKGSFNGTGHMISEYSLCKQDEIDFANERKRDIMNLAKNLVKNQSNLI